MIYFRNGRLNLLLVNNIGTIPTLQTLFSIIYVHYDLHFVNGHKHVKR